MPPPVQSIKDEAVSVMGVTWCGFINPRHMHRRVTVLCVSVCYHASCYIPRLYVQSEAS